MGYWHRLRARKLQRIISRLHEIMWLLQPEGSAVLSAAEGGVKLTMPASARLEEGGGAAAEGGATALEVEAAAAATEAATEAEAEAEPEAEAEAAEVARGGYRAVAAARLAVARGDAQSSLRVGAEDLMSVLNQEQGAGRRFSRDECEAALRASGSGGWAYPYNPQDWLGADQLLRALTLLLRQDSALGSHVASMGLSPPVSYKLSSIFSMLVTTNFLSAPWEGSSSSSSSPVVSDWFRQASIHISFSTQPFCIAYSIFQIALAIAIACCCFFLCIIQDMVFAFNLAAHFQRSCFS